MLLHLGQRKVKGCTGGLSPPGFSREEQVGQTKIIVLLVAYSIIPNIDPESELTLATTCSPSLRMNSSAEVSPLRDNKRLFWLVAKARPSSKEITFDSISSLITESKSCMPSSFPSRIASSSDLPSASPVSMYSLVRGLERRISATAIRPRPSARGISR